MTSGMEKAINDKWMGGEYEGAEMAASSYLLIIFIISAADNVPDQG